jgi:Domain of unknown function (DUF4194)
MKTGDLPEFRPWFAAAIRLLQGGAVYSDDSRTWDTLLASQSPLRDYFARIGLLLVLDEPEGLAYLRQLTEDELPEEYDGLPKLFRRARLGYDETLLCVLLREELRRFEEEDIDNDRCGMDAAQLFEQWQSIAPSRHDEVRARRDLSAALGKLEELGFVRKYSDEPEAWEIRRILKARLPVAELEALKAKLLDAAKTRGGSAAAKE